MYHCGKVEGGLVTVHKGSFSSWRNAYGSQFETQCGPDEVLGGLKSVHGDAEKDRRFDYFCNKLDDAEIVPHAWTDYEGLDGEWNASCAENEAMWQVMSVFVGEKEDRKWRYKCAAVAGKVATTQFTMEYLQWKDWTWLEGDTDRKCDNNVLIGIESLFDRDKQDRKWRQLCSKVTGDVVTIREDVQDIRVGTKDRFTKYLESFSFECPPGSVMSGWGSQFDKPHDDRRYKFRCNALLGLIVTPEESWSTFNDVTSRSAHVCPGHSALFGIQSTFTQPQDDRQFQYKCASLRWSDMGFTMQYGTWMGYTVHGWGTIKKDCTTKVMVGFGSTFDWNDRQWRVMCGQVESLSHSFSVNEDIDNVDLDSDSGFINDLAKDFTFECPTGSFMAGFAAKRDDSYFDRRFKFKCNEITGATTTGLTWTSWSVAGERTQHICPSYAAISGIDSQVWPIPFNKVAGYDFASQMEFEQGATKVERLWRFRCSSLEFS